jgi:putative hydrolase of the HAD superfamily
VVRAVLFDFGGVITSSPFEAFANYEQRQGLPDGFIRRVNSTNPDTNAWARLERSELSIAGFDEAFADESARLGHRVPGLEVLALLGGEVRPVMAAAVRRLALNPRYVTAVLTNNFLGSGGGGSAPMAWAGVLDMVDAVVESSRLGVRKPDPAFYELACAELGISPTEAVFLDDLGINLKPARAMGMATIKVTDPVGALQELAGVLGVDAHWLVGPTDAAHQVTER